MIQSIKGTSSKKNDNKQNLKEVLSLLKKDKAVEVRILNTPKGVVSGVFDNYEKLESQLSEYEGKHNIFFTLNDFNYTKISNYLYTYSKNTIKDDDIIKRDYILIDVDPERLSNTSSTNDEHDKAISKAKRIKDSLIVEGFQEPILADSGNGAHLLVKVDMDNTKEVTDLIKRFLNILAKLYDDNESKIDITTYNASRITKLYGTIACKGENTEERPHRRSCLIDDIEGKKLEATPRDVIEKFVKKNSKTIASSNVKKISYENSVSKSSNQFDLKGWLDKHGIEYTNIKEIDNGKLYALKHCLFDTGHDDSQGASIIQFNNGFVHAKCLHAKCHDETKCNWDYIWNKFEPGKPNPNGNISRGQNVQYKSFEGKKNRCDMVIDLIKDNSIPVFKDEFGQMYIKMDKTYKLGSNDCNEAIQKLIYSAYDVTLGRNQISNIETGAIVFCHEVRKVVRRFGYYKDVYFFNTMNNDNIIIINKKDGEYTPVLRDLKKHPLPIEFYTTSEDRACCIPKSGEDDMKLKDYFDKHFTAIPQQERILFDVLTVYRFLNHLQQPLGVIIGRRGSGKTFVCKLLNALIDPTISPIISKPKGVDDFKVLLGNRDNIIFDNYSDNFSQNISDVLCLSVTGGTSSNRKLYTNDEIIHQNLKCGVYVTAIDNPVSKTDLSDRSLYFHLERILSSDRCSEDDLLKSFNSDLPYMYGHIFHIIADVLNKIDELSSTKGSPIRLTDFYKYGQIIAEEIGYSKEEFRDCLINNKKYSDEDLANDDDFVLVLVEFCQKIKNFHGTMTEFYSDFEQYLGSKKMKIENYVSGPASLSKKINHLDEVLYTREITFTRSKSNGNRIIKMKCKTEPIEDSKEEYIQEQLIDMPF